MTYIERKTNRLPLTDLDPASPYEAVVTFEGPEHLSETEKVVSTTVHHDVGNAINSIVSHLQYMGIELLSACFYFKQGAKDQLHLLYATSIKCAKVHHLSINSDMNTFFDVPEEAKFFKKSNVTDNGTLGAVRLISGSSSYRQRPQSAKVQRRGHSMAGNALAAKNQCPFCELHLERSDMYEYSIKTIIKLVSYFREHSATLKEVNKRLYYKSLMCMRENEVPGPIRAIYPSMTYQRYSERLTDPLFLYEYTRVCETCYEYLQRVLKNIERDTETPDLSVSVSTGAAGFRTISSISKAREGSPFISS